MEEDKVTEKDVNKLRAIVDGISLDRLEVICNAERDGRCVVLPCKVGCKIWTIENVYNGKGIVKMLGTRVIDEITHNKLNKNTMISKQLDFELHFFPTEIGKTVFFTRAEAVAALRGEEQQMPKYIEKCKNFSESTFEEVDSFVKEKYGEGNYIHRFYSMDGSYGWHPIGNEHKELAFFSTRTDRGYVYYEEGTKK